MPGPKGNREFVVHFVHAAQPELPPDLERWLAVESPSTTGKDRAKASEPDAIDRDVLVAWLGDDREAIDIPRIGIGTTAYRSIAATQHAHPLNPFATR